MTAEHGKLRAEIVELSVKRRHRLRSHTACAPDPL